MTDPNGGSSDSDFDGISDRLDNCMGVANPPPAGLTQVDTDMDGFGDACSPDSDGDALYDEWETTGVDANGDGTIDLNLAAMGASPSRKDIFVEVDYMSCVVAASDCVAGDTHNHTPIALGMSAVAGAFNVAPVDSGLGVNLHILVDEPVRHQNIVDADYAFNSIKPLYFGTPAERASPNWPNIREARRMAFHWALFAHEEPGLLLFGQGEIPGNDLIVWAGNQKMQEFADKMPGGLAGIHAGTFMHELGHDLGLRHGGNQDLFNCKPNYLSVMNYASQYRAYNQDATLDYSRAELPLLNENSLNENAGIGGPAGQLTVYGPPPVKAAAADGPIDWDRDGVLESSVAVDIKRLGTPPACDLPFGLAAYTGFNDWPNLVYNFRVSGYYANSEFAGPEELKVDDVKKMLIESPTVDSDGDGTPNGPDLDPDNDGVPDATDNCVFHANAGQADFDADDVGDVCDPDDDNDGLADGSDPDDDNDLVNDTDEAGCGGTTPSALRPERVDGIFDNVDDDGDTMVDEAITGAASFDCDGDGFKGSAENHVYSYLPGPPTNGDQKTCQEYDSSFAMQPRPSLRWPADLRGDGISINKVNIVDLATFTNPVRHLNTSPGDTYFHVRWDLVPGTAVGKQINVADMAALTTGLSGSPPMLGGVKAFNGPVCPYTP